MLKLIYRIIIAAFFILLSTQSHAEYSIKIPLELHNGGSLPNGTLNLIAANGGAGGSGNEPTTPGPAATDEASCMAKIPAAKSVIAKAGYTFDEVQYVSAEDMNSETPYCIAAFYKLTCTMNSKDHLALIDNLIAAGFTDARGYTRCP